MRLFRYEHRSKGMASPVQFAGRLINNVLVVLAMTAIALAIGMAGYHAWGRLSWIDSFLNASMLLGGMGPVDAMPDASGKLFSGLYSLFCGLFIIIASGVVLAPILHRVLHALHADDAG